MSALSKVKPQLALLLEVNGGEKSSTEGRNDVEKACRQVKDLQVLRQGVLRQVSLDELEIRDIVRVLPGSSPPLDGVIVSSNVSSFDESVLTGESMPVSKVKGDNVFSGTICKGSAIDIQISKLGGETM